MRDTPTEKRLRQYTTRPNEFASVAAAALRVIRELRRKLQQMTEASTSAFVARHYPKD